MTSLALKLANPFKFSLLHILLLVVAAAFLAGSIHLSGELSQGSARKALAADAAYYKSALNHFQTTYQALPGDMKNASSYWQDCRYDIADCNGNGDGLITSGASDATTEAALAWQHLSLSGFINETYSGNLISGYYIPEQNMPTAPYEDTGYLIQNSVPYSHASWEQSHFLTVGAISDWRFNNPAVSLSDAMALDEKLDDGIASTGDIFAYSTEKDHCLEDYNRQILVGKQLGHYAKEADAQARCNLYVRLN